jgi:hypothetical protein
MTGGFNLEPALAGRSRKSLNPNIVTTADTRFYLLRILGDFPATCLLPAAAGSEEIAATQPNAAETV